MDQEVKIRLNDGTVRNYPKGITCLEISKEFKDQFENDIICAKKNNDICSLSEVINDDCTLEFLDLSTSFGNRIYEKGLVYLFIYAVKSIFGLRTKIDIRHSIDKGLYTVIDTPKPLNKQMVDEILLKMKSLVEEDARFEKVSIPKKEAIEYFRKINRQDKVEVLNYLSNTYITLYRFKNIYDYFYGDMPYSAGYLKKFTLTYLNGSGIVIRYPNVSDPKRITDYVHHEKLFEAFNEYSDWGKLISVETVPDLNREVSKGRIGDLIRLEEMIQNSHLLDIAKKIVLNKNKVKLVLIAGPSSSGKTTTSKKLELFLKGMGLKPHAVSIDDYFVDRENTPLDENNEPDYESVKSLDLELFNNQLRSLLAGNEVLMPRYNFIEGRKEFVRPLKLDQGDILVIEGLHALNEQLTVGIPRNEKFKIYISPLTVLNIDDHNRINTTDVRLLRRMIRDNLTRGYNPTVTIDNWKKVRKGEEKFVFPYQDEADEIFNTALIYELGVLKTYGEPLLFSVHPRDKNYAEAVRLIDLLRSVLPIPSEDVPRDSLLREFIGNSCFESSKSALS